MTIAFLNGEYKPLSEVTISPLDRGFLFGEGIYEVIPVMQSELVAPELHLGRLINGLSALSIKLHYSQEQLVAALNQVIGRNSLVTGSVYLHVTRGASDKRNHAFPDECEATVLIMVQSVDEAEPSIELQPLKVCLQLDKRWRNCHIKSTSLLGNVLHYQHAKEQGAQETILFNDNNMVTEGSTSNVFVLKENKLYTHPLDSQILPGITRHILLDVVRQHTSLTVIEQPVTVEQLLAADEVWISSSSKGLAPIVSVDEHAIAGGDIGVLAQQVSELYVAHLSDYR